MPNPLNNSLVISSHDYDCLLAIAEKYDTPAAWALNRELSRAEIAKAADLPHDVVAMNSSVTFKDLDSGEKTTLSLVYPLLADVDEMKISVLTPVGTALIGLRVGGEIDWPLPNGKIRRLQVVSVAKSE